VLARIELVEGVEWAAAEATGRYLAVRFGAGFEEERVMAGVERALGARGRRVGDALARAQLAAHHRGDPWFTAREAHALSYIEGRLVSVHVATRVGAELKLDREARDALAEAVRQVFFGVLERVHAEGGRESSGWFYVEWPGIAREAAARMAGVFPADAGLEARVAGCYTRSR
jgi:hypothetical protein